MQESKKPLLSDSKPLDSLEVIKNQPRPQYLNHILNRAIYLIPVIAGIGESVLTTSLLSELTPFETIKKYSIFEKILIAIAIAPPYFFLEIHEFHKIVFKTPPCRNTTTNFIVNDDYFTFFKSLLKKIPYFSIIFTCCLIDGIVIGSASQRLFQSLWLSIFLGLGTGLQFYTVEGYGLKRLFHSSFWELEKKFLNFSSIRGWGFFKKMALLFFPNLIILCGSLALSTLAILDNYSLFRPFYFDELNMSASQAVPATLETAGMLSLIYFSTHICLLGNKTKRILLDYFFQEDSSSINSNFREENNQQYMNFSLKSVTSIILALLFSLVRGTAMYQTFQALQIYYEEAFSKNSVPYVMKLILSILGFIASSQSFITHGMHILTIRKGKYVGLELPKKESNSNKVYNFKQFFKDTASLIGLSLPKVIMEIIYNFKQSWNDIILSYIPTGVASCIVFLLSICHKKDYSKNTIDLLKSNKFRILIYFLGPMWLGIFSQKLFHLLIGTSETDHEVIQTNTEFIGVFFSSLLTVLMFHLLKPINLKSDKSNKYNHKNNSFSHERLLSNLDVISDYGSLENHLIERLHNQNNNEDITIDIWEDKPSQEECEEKPDFKNDLLESKINTDDNRSNEVKKNPTSIKEIKVLSKKYNQGEKNTDIEEKHEDSSKKDPCNLFSFFDKLPNSLEHLEHIPQIRFKYLQLITNRHNSDHRQQDIFLRPTKSHSTGQLPISKRNSDLYISDESIFKDTAMNSYSLDDDESSALIKFHLYKMGALK